MYPPVLSIPKSEIKKAIQPEMIKAAQNYVVAKAFVQVVEPIVTGYQREILAKNQFTNKGQIDRRKIKGTDFTMVEIITDPKQSYNLSDEDFASYHQQCNEARIAAKLHVDNPEHCPLLVAESTLRSAERLLLDAMEPLNGFNSSTTGLWKADLRKKAIDLSIGLIAGQGLLKNTFEKSIKKSN
jgi:hypothetical protein